MSTAAMVAIVVVAAITIAICWVVTLAEGEDKLDRLLDLDTPTPDELVRQQFDLHDEEGDR